MRALLIIHFHFIVIQESHLINLLCGDELRYWYCNDDYLLIYSVTP